MYVCVRDYSYNIIIVFFGCDSLLLINTFIFESFFLIDMSVDKIVVYHFLLDITF